MTVKNVKHKDLTIRAVIVIIFSLGIFVDAGIESGNMAHIGSTTIPYPPNHTTLNALSVETFIGRLRINHEIQLIC